MSSYSAARAFIRFRHGFLCIALALGAAVVIALFSVRSRDPYRDLRLRVQHQVGIPRLQTWAVSVLDNPAQAFAGPEGRIRNEDLPEDIRVLAENGFVVYEKARVEVGLEEHILFACGGGFYHWGLRVGRRGYQPSPDSQFHFEQLADGVWGLHER
jgi:hypothetical protein